MFEKDLITIQDDLLRYGLRLTGSIDKAEDLVQQTFFKALKYKHQFKEGTSIRRWCFTILRNECYTNSRKNRMVSDPNEALINTLAVAPEQEIMIQFRELEDVISTLTPEHRRSIEMVLINGLSYQDAADIEGVALGTMKSRVCRARSDIKDQLGDLLTDPISTSVRLNNDNFRASYSR